MNLQLPKQNFLTSGSGQTDATTKNLPRLFLDLDGVFFDFEEGFKQAFGKPRTECKSAKEFWELVDSYPDFFYHLKVIPQSLLLLEYIEENLTDYLSDIIFLSSASNKDFVNNCRKKTAAVQDKLGSKRLVVCTPGGTKKGAFVQTKGDLLIDDTEANKVGWVAEGGEFIHHQNSLAISYGVTLFTLKTSLGLIKPN